MEFYCRNGYFEGYKLIQINVYTKMTFVDDERFSSLPCYRVICNEENSLAFMQVSKDGAEGSESKVGVIKYGRNPLQMDNRQRIKVQG